MDVSLTTIVPAALIVVGLITFYVWYRRKIASMAPSDTTAPSGVRLTAERLRTLSSPPWRVVFEIADDRLGGVDHVIIGSSGTIAVRTVLADRPPIGPRDDDPSAIARAAIARGDVDELVGTVGLRCDRSIVVYWGTPRPDEPGAHEVAPGEWAVEGQRLVDWLIALPPGTESTAQVDLAWQAVTTGIGRPDPLA